MEESLYSAWKKNYQTTLIDVNICKNLPSELLLSITAVLHYFQLFFDYLGQMKASKSIKSLPGL